MPTRSQTNEACELLLEGQDQADEVLLSSDKSGTDLLNSAQSPVDRHNDGCLYFQPYEEDSDPPVSNSFRDADDADVTKKSDEPVTFGMSLFNRATIGIGSSIPFTRKRSESAIEFSGGQEQILDNASKVKNQRSRRSLGSLSDPAWGSCRDELHSQNSIIESFQLIQHESSKGEGAQELPLDLCGTKNLPPEQIANLSCVESDDSPSSYCHSTHRSAEGHSKSGGAAGEGAPNAEDDSCHPNEQLIKDQIVYVWKCAASRRRQEFEAWSYRGSHNVNYEGDVFDSVVEWVNALDQPLYTQQAAERLT